MPELDELAKGTDVFILQNMGPIEDLDGLSYESKLLIKVCLRSLGVKSCGCKYMNQGMWMLCMSVQA